MEINTFALSAVAPAVIVSGCNFFFTLFTSYAQAAEKEMYSSKCIHVNQTNGAFTFNKTTLGCVPGCQYWQSSNLHKNYRFNSVSIKKQMLQMKSASHLLSFVFQLLTMQGNILCTSVRRKSYPCKLSMKTSAG